MISIEDYLNLVQDVLDRNLADNPAQQNGVSHEGDNVLMLVAGPGSGKTTVLVLRALRHVLVDDILPEEILITTFTRKAAKELRTRWIDWGNSLLRRLQQDARYRERIHQIDLNRCRIDTLDSIAQQALTESRLPGQMAPTLVESSASKLILKRFAFGDIYRSHKADVDQFLTRYTFDGKPPKNNGDALSNTKTLCDRLTQDLVDLGRFGSAGATHRLIVDILERYKNRLQETNIFDFATLELRLLERLRERSMDAWTSSIRALLIDEYQDTNPLQESIYFEIVSTSSPFVTIVGDDDQSMYRFRGGSVELFTQFEGRCRTATGRGANRLDMVSNYRSSDEIVEFYNEHITGDADFSSARIAPPKPQVVSFRGTLNMPVIGMFRQDASELSESLASWLEETFSNRRAVLSTGDEHYEITISADGALGDCAFLSHSVEEVKYDRYNHRPVTHFPGLLRENMERRGMNIFNPRGNSLRNIQSVQQLLGLVLLCLDPDGQNTTEIFPTSEASFFLNSWRNEASSLLNLNPHPSGNGGLRRFVQQWQEVSRGNSNSRFPPDWPALELLFKLITWMPSFQNDPEHQVWLEAITRTVSSIAMASPYNMKILQADNSGDSNLARSRQSFIRDALLPIAENEVRVDEDIMPSVPRTHLQFMTIHQAKGLEFPLVIVDVGSRFKTNHHTQKFLRFPSKASNVVIMEDDVEPYLAAPLRSGRDPLDRSFDDLMRLYYVAYSRPQSVLMLVGCEKLLNYGKGKKLTGVIPNVALGWARSGHWPWRQPLTGTTSPIRVDPPLLLI